MNNQKQDAIDIYQCFMCYLKRDTNAYPTYTKGSTLISHMNDKHGFQLTPRDSSFRKTRFIGGYKFLRSDDGHAVKRLCCPSCGFNTSLDGHVDLYLHYHDKGHVRRLGDAPDPATIRRPQQTPSRKELPERAQTTAAARRPRLQQRGQPQAAAEQAAPPEPAPRQLGVTVVEREPSDEEIREMTRQRGWYWPDIDRLGEAAVWLDYARHGDPNFIKRRDFWRLRMTNQYIANSHPDDIANQEGDDAEDDHAEDDHAEDDHAEDDHAEDDYIEWI